MIKTLFDIGDIWINVYSDEAFVAAFADLLQKGSVPYLHLTDRIGVSGHYHAVFQSFVVEALLLLFSRWETDHDTVKVPQGVFVSNGAWYVEGCVGTWQAKDEVKVFPTYIPMPYIIAEPVKPYNPPYTVTCGTAAAYPHPTLVS